MALPEPALTGRKCEAPPGRTRGCAFRERCSSNRCPCDEWCFHTRALMPVSLPNLAKRQSPKPNKLQQTPTDSRKSPVFYPTKLEKVVDSGVGGIPPNDSSIVISFCGTNEHLETVWQWG